MMKRMTTGWWSPTVMAVTMMVLAGTGAPAAAQGSSDARDVTLTLSLDGSGGCTITVDPENATIWRGKKQKLKKVEWVATPNDTHDELFWELRWDPDKGGGTEDYFGAVDLACGESHIKVQPSPKPDIPNAEWPYAVTVYSCEDGSKGAELCSVDPRIRWED